MTTRPVKQPSAEHPITIEPIRGRVRVRVNGELIADTRSALGLHESVYPVAYYLPISDVDRNALSRSETHTYCPYKGDAGYYSVTIGDMTVADAIWTYEDPHPAVAEIAGHLAFYPNKAEVIVDA